MSNWAEAMNADALAISAPEYELKPGETARVDVEWDEGYKYSTYTYEDPSFTIRVYIDSPAPLGTTRCVGYYYNDDAREFFLKLMQRGSQ